MKLDFRKNLGSTDRIIRFVIGFILLGLAGMRAAKGWLAIVATVLAFSQFIEGAAGY